MKSTKNINFQQKSLIRIFFTTLALLLMLYFLIFPYTKKVSKANIALSEHRTNFETKLIKEEKLSKISKNLNDIESRAKNIDKVFIDENNKLEFITMLEGLAEKNFVNLEIKIDFNKIDPIKKTNQINLVVNGSHLNTMNFLTTLESLIYYFNIYNININSNRTNIGNATIPGTNLSQNSLTMDINAITYWK